MQHDDLLKKRPAALVFLYILASYTSVFGQEFYYGRHIAMSQLTSLHRTVDMVGNTRTVLTPSGTPLETYSYSPFGVQTIRDATGNEIPSSAYGVTLGYGSRPLVTYLNTLDFHHRLFNPPTGAFLSTDPLHYIDTHNDRQYAMHNPIDLTDYHGLMSTGGGTAAQGTGTGVPIIPPTGNPTSNGESPNGPDICVNGGAPANNLPWIMQDVQLQSPGEYEQRLREKLDELIKQHGEDIITAHESGALVPWARPPEYVIWLLNGDRPAFQAAISTQSQADLAKALINGRKPKPYEPGGWAFNALGPNGAAYELIAVFAGVTAAPRVFRGSTAPAPAQIQTALIPRSPRTRPVTASHTASNAAHDPAAHGPRPNLTIANAAGGSPIWLPKQVPGGEHSPQKPYVLYYVLKRGSITREQLLSRQGFWSAGRNLSFVEHARVTPDTGFIRVADFGTIGKAVSLYRGATGRSPYVFVIDTYELQAFHLHSVLRILSPTEVAASYLNWVIPINIPTRNIVEGGRVRDIAIDGPGHRVLFEPGSHYQVRDY